MGGVTVSITEEGRKEVIAMLDSIKNSMPSLHRQILSLLCEDIISISQKDYLSGQVLKRKTGKLANSLTYRLIGNSDAEVGTNLIYAAIHEYGGEIRPKNKKFLHWVSPTGEQVFTKGPVLMPERPFLRPALEKEFSSGRAKQIAELALEKYIQGQVATGV